jgi:aminopeptidase N
MRQRVTKIERVTRTPVSARTPAGHPARRLLTGGGPCSIGRASAALVSAALASAVMVTAAWAGPADQASNLTEAGLRRAVQSLGAPEMDGRGPGSAGLEKSRDEINEAFRRIGLTPGGDGGTFLQSFIPAPGDIRGEFRLPEGRAWGSIAMQNVVGLLPGRVPDAPCLVISAHYDHLGRSANGIVFPGADDNASGVAVLQELAAQMHEEAPFRNTVVFAAFSGEEEGTLGAKHYLQHATCPLERTLAILNLDTVGRMEGKKLFVFGTATAVEFPEIVKGVNLGAGLELVTPEAAPLSSDEAPFHDRAIPALQFFTGPNADYHRVTDTPEKLNYPGLSAVLDFARETAIFLAEREDRLTFVPSTGRRAPIVPAGPPRRSGLGTIPDFGRESGGVLLAGTTPGSPAERAGLAKGDIIVSISGMPIDNLGDLSAVLKAHPPGDTVEVVFKRGNEELRRRIGVVERK